MELTEAEIKKYLEADGNICPRCGSSDITGISSVQTDAGGAWQDIECEACGAAWTDLYELVNVAGREA